MKENSKQMIVIYLRTYSIWRTIETFSEVLGIYIYWNSTNNYPSCFKKPISYSYVLSLTEESPCIWILCIAFYSTQAQMQMLQKPDYELNVLFYGGGSWTYARQQTAPVFMAWATLFIRSYFVRSFSVCDYCGALKAGDHFCHWMNVKVKTSYSVGAMRSTQFFVLDASRFCGFG